MALAEIPRGPGGKLVRGALMPVGRTRDLSVESIEYLASVMRDTQRITKHRVTAAKALLAYHQWREDYDLAVDPVGCVRRMLGDREQAKVVLRQTLRQLEAETPSRTDEVSDDGRDDDER